jgi:hypothetical protein
VISSLCLHTKSTVMSCLFSRSQQMDVLNSMVTAFFINGNGTFLTAGHVMNAAQAEVAKSGGTICLTTRIPESSNGITSEVLSAELAPAPFDIAIGSTSRPSDSFVRLANATAVAPLQNVMTFGYPESAQLVNASGLVLSHRVHKGYIIRILDAGSTLMHPHPMAFELDFPIPSALSGAPLVLERPATSLERALMAAPGMIPVIGNMMIDVRLIPRHALHLVGVCVGTTQAETVAFAYSEIIDGSTKFSEKTSKIELYGLAHDLLSLADWSPACLQGATLAQAIEPT